METGEAHGFDGFRIFHEGAPYKPSAVIFGHEDGGTNIDSHDVCVVPPGDGVEGVHEAVSLPGARIIPANILEDADAVPKQERQ